MSASSALRTLTSDEHAALESSPMGRLLSSGQLEKTVLAEYLRCLWIVLTNLRAQLRRHGTSPQRELLSPLDEWLGFLAEDLADLAPPHAAANTAAHDAALALVAELRRHARARPPWALGVAYVLYGSHLGNRSIAEAVKSGLALPGDSGTRYLQATRGDAGFWPRFRAQLDRQLESEDDLQPAVEGAKATFTAFSDMFEALLQSPARAPRASAINPEAGDHPVIQQGEQLQAALEVGRRCHQAWGYLQRRFGDRGERFARSDSAWLATLGSLPEETACAQAHWLARLLSARGIPSPCLEHHLDALHAALTGEQAQASPAGASLARLSRHVRSLREEEPNPRLQALVEEPLTALDPRGAELLVGAVLDERAGLAPCATNISAWAESAPELEPTERRAIVDFIADARESCAP